MASVRESKAPYHYSGHGSRTEEVEMDRRVAGTGLLVVLAMGVALSWGRQSAPPSAEARTGWISDEACGAEHTKPGKADCVEKCWRGGAGIGHPEWKPQRAVFVADDTKAIWIIENADAVKRFPAVHVRVSGRFDGEKKSVQVEAVETLK
jgi:hypothetical protein